MPGGSRIQIPIICTISNALKLHSTLVQLVWKSQRRSFEFEKLNILLMMAPEGLIQTWVPHGRSVRTRWRMCLDNQLHSISCFQTALLEMSRAPFSAFIGVQKSDNDAVRSPAAQKGSSLRSSYRLHSKWAQGKHNGEEPPPSPLFIHVSLGPSHHQALGEGVCLQRGGGELLAEFLRVSVAGLGSTVVCSETVCLAVKWEPCITVWYISIIISPTFLAV